MAYAALLVPSAGIEPATPRLGLVRSVQLSYEGIVIYNAPYSLPAKTAKSLRSIAPCLPESSQSKNRARL